MRCRVSPFVAFVLLAPAAAQEPLIELPDAGDGWRPTAALGDVDGDRIPDLVLGRNGPFAVRLGEPAAVGLAFARERPLGIAVECSCENAGQPQLVDLDGDGDLDLLTVDTPMRAKGGHLVWFANNGKGTFAPKTPVRTAEGGEFACAKETSAVIPCDWDGDGHLDLLVAARRITLHRGSAKGIASAGERFVQTTEGALAVADWDRDGRLDLLVVEKDGLVLHPGRGEPKVLTEVARDSGQVQLAVADWNDDGKLDAMLIEPLPERSRPTTAEGELRLATARKIVDLIHAELLQLDQEPLPKDEAARKRRENLRLELTRWAAAPRDVVVAATPHVQPFRTRYLLGR